MQEADLLVFNARIYTVDSAFTVTEALAVKNGKIIFTGTNSDAEKKIKAGNVIDAKGKYIFPGFIDAHCHFYGYGKGLSELDLTNTASEKEVMDSVIYYAKEQDMYPEKSDIDLTKPKWIVGRGWDQNDWEVKEFPDKKRLDTLFPNTPVILKRVDGHAILVNQKALNIAGFTEKTKINGGELILKDGKLTGVLVDNAADSLEKSIPKADRELIERALLKAQENCLTVGLTTIDDAGLDKDVVEMIDELQKANKLKMRVYAMLSPTEENYKMYLRSGPYKTDKLNVRSFKFYADGALGSRGACLMKDYSDKPGWKGFMLNDLGYFMKAADQMQENKFQLNVHCIGDSAVRALIQVFATVPKMFGDMDGKLFKEIVRERRWRIEHAQIVDKADVNLFKELGIIPSVQPTHATSDMYWAEQRIGRERMKSAYAYKELLNAAGRIALGTDFPVEDISPFKTFYAAVYRKDAKGFPEGGFQMENALTREETMKGMTIWAAYSNFEEKEKGSLEKGKFADFLILDTDLMKCGEKEILNAKVISTFIGGERVYQLEP
jgi:predicted amidohydrolase YtcJ